MPIDTDLKIGLQAELKQLLVKHKISGDDAEVLLAKIWPDIEEVLDFAEFTDTLGSETQDTELIDPLAHLSNEEREAHIQERLARMNPEARSGLARSRGKWEVGNG